MSLRALLYADWCVLRNEWRRVSKSRSRLALWSLYAVGGTVVIGARLISHHRPIGTAGVVERADYVVCAILLTLVISLATGSGAVGIFRTLVEARFIIGSPVCAPLAIAYLQSREALGQGVRRLFFLVYFIFGVTFGEIGATTALADLALVIGVIIAGAAVLVPRRLLPPRGHAACLIAGVPIGLLVLAPALRDVVAQLGSLVPAALARPILAAVPAWHPGRVLLEPNLLWLLAIGAFAAAGIGALAIAGRDAYPELYALAAARIERREGLLPRRTKTVPAHTGQPRPLALPAPPGVMAIVWKSVIEFRRVVHPAYIAAGSVCACVAGVAAARLAAMYGSWFDTLLGFLPNLIILAGVGPMNGIVGELRRPLFWLSSATLFERLSALACARIWLKIGVLELVAAGFALGGGPLADTLVFAVGLPALVALSASVGFATLALFPSPADQRGPLMLVRYVAAVLLFIPPLIVYAIGDEGFSAPRTALIVASLQALAESGTLLGIAAWRLDGRIDRILS